MNSEEAGTALDDLWWARKGFTPQEVDDMPAQRAHWLKAVWVVRDDVVDSAPNPDADAARLADAWKKAGWQ